MAGYTKLSNIMKSSNGVMFVHCPGCGYLHGINVERIDRDIWSWNKSVDKPTFSPSLLVRTGRAIDPTFIKEEGDPPEVCHSFIRDGKFVFLSDCDHDLAGKTVDIPSLPED